MIIKKTGHRNIILINLYYLIACTLLISEKSYASEVQVCHYYDEDCSVCDNNKQYGQCVNYTEGQQPLVGNNCTLLADDCLVCDDLLFYGCQNNMLEDASVVTETQDQCEISICLSGGSGENSPANQTLNHFCSSAAVKNPMQQCINGECSYVWSNFGQRNWQVVYPALFKEMDFNQDGYINSQDPKCKINIIGFSWGGINSIMLARYIQFDKKIDYQHKKIENIITFDAYQPFVFRRAEIPSNVKNANIFLRNLLTSDDCSNDEFGGPYIGVFPRCTNKTQCNIYNWSSLNEYVPFTNFGYRGHIHSQDIGHCSAIGASLPAAQTILKGQKYNGPLPKNTQARPHWKYKF